MDFTEKTISKNYIYHGKIINLRCDDIVTSDNKPHKREIVEHPGGAAILYEENGKILLVRQYRYAYGEHIYEIPAGKLEKGEDPKLAAIRELEEEAGVRASDLELLYVMYPTPGYTNEKIYIYYAKNCEHVSVHLDEGEFLEDLYVSKDELKKWLEEGKINDGKTILALQWALMQNN